MRILHVISSMSVENGGPTTCTNNLIVGLHNRGVRVNLLTYVDHHEQLDTPNLIGIKSPARKRFGISSQLLMWKDWKNFDLLHLNGLWQFIVVFPAFKALMNDIDYIISPHGMLYPEGLKKSRWIKKIALMLYQNKILRSAKAFHATSQDEVDVIRNLGYRQPIALIPNGVRVAELNGKIDLNSSSRKIRFGFIGRIVPIKNLEFFFRAWHQVSKSNTSIELVVVGDGEKNYVEELKDLTDSLGIENVHWFGFMTGLELDNTLQSLDFLILPSKSENFGMVIAEALANSIPVLASKGTPWMDLVEFKCGWHLDFTEKAWVDAIIEASSMSNSNRLVMKKNALDLVKRKYSVEAVARKMENFYQFILFGKKEEHESFIKILE